MDVRTKQLRAFGGEADDFDVCSHAALAQNLRALLGARNIVPDAPR